MKVNVGLTLIELGGLLLVIVIAVAALVDGEGDAGRAFEFKAGEPSSARSSAAPRSPSTR